LILIGGYVTTSISGLGCGESWPSCNGTFFPSLNNPSLVIEWTHRLFNLVVGVFILGTALVAWTKYRDAKYVLGFSTASFVGLVAQVILGMVTVQTGLDPTISDAHLGLASAVFAVVVANAVMVWNLNSGKFVVHSARIVHDQVRV
jgi:cytochrome c oxidase assembly protein subunit 15